MNSNLVSTAPTGGRECLGMWEVWGIWVRKESEEVGEEKEEEEKIKII